MTTKQVKKLIHQGEYVAEVEVELLYADDNGWSPYLSLADASRLDDVRLAFGRGDLEVAGIMAKVYKLTPVAG